MSACKRSVSHLVPLADPAVHAHVPDVAEGYGAVRDAPALQRAGAGHEAALGALRVHPRLKCMPLRSPRRTHC